MVWVEGGKHSRNAASPGPSSIPTKMFFGGLDLMPIQLAFRIRARPTKESSLPMLKMMRSEAKPCRTGNASQAVSTAS